MTESFGPNWFEEGLEDYLRTATDEELMEDAQGKGTPAEARAILKRALDEAKLKRLLEK